MAAIPRLPLHLKPPTRLPQRPAEGAERPRLQPRPRLITMIRLKMRQRRLVVILMELGHRAAVKRMILFLLLNRPPVTPRLGTIFPNARTVNAFSDSTIRTRKSPLCPSIDAGHRCHKEGGPDGCPLWDRPKAQAEEPAPKTDANPPRRTRKKREE